MLSTKDGRFSDGSLIILDGLGVGLVQFPPPPG